MALNVYRPGDPAPGQEISVAVPGEYIYDVYQLAATLTNNSGSNIVGLTAHDSSGNGHDGTYGGLFAQPHAALVTNGQAVDFAADSPTPGSGGDVLLPNNAAAFGNAWSIAFWWAQTVDVNPTNAVEILAGPNAAGAIQIGPGIGGDLFRINGTPGEHECPFTGFTFPLDGSAHLIGGTCSKAGATFTLTSYADGVALDSTTDTVANHVDANQANYLNGSKAGTFPVDPQGAATLEAVALFNFELSPSDWTNLFAAGTDIATYTAAVLALAPASYYLLDEGLIPAPTTPVLQLTDGTNILATFPGSFTPVGPTSTIFRWTTGILDLPPTVGSDVAYNQLGRYTLPGGYTFQTITAGLGPTDQWSDVQLWVDQRFSGPGGGYPPIDYQNVLILG